MSSEAQDHKILSQRCKNYMIRLREQLQNRNQKYKIRVDQRIREIHFKVGDQVLVHLRKDIFPKGNYNKLKMKNIGPCKILRKFATNAYEIELPEEIGISPIFNVADMYPYRMDDTRDTDGQEEI
jgi:hypothetical protein